MDVAVVDFTAADAPARFTESLRSTGFAVLVNHPLPWSLVEQIYAEWSAFFAATAGKRAQAQVGMAVVSLREADDLVRDAEQFLERVSASLGLAHQSVLIES